LNVTARAWTPALAALALAVAGCGSGGAGTASPAVPAARLSDQAGQLLGGGTGAFRRQLAALRGTPVVVNQWASWCGPCRFEFPVFASLARRHRGRVAFLGVDSQDSRDDARRFLRQLRVPYPSFYDPDVSVARTFRGGAAWPTTAFYDAGGRLVHTHVGPYDSAASLDADVRRYAVGGRA
jgi:cytochrome c biogenesis protein CcmG, thiol:disulfide interchange protein DsbE